MTLNTLKSISFAKECASFIEFLFGLEPRFKYLTVIGWNKDGLTA